MPRAGLDTDAVVDAASRVADADGLEALSLTRVAAELGVRPPSLYAHIGGLGDLRRRLAIRGTRELAGAMQAAVAGRSGGDALRAAADVYRRYALEHPGLYASFQRAPSADDEEWERAAASVVGVVLAVLRGYELAGDAAIHAARILRASLHGFVSLEAGGGFAIPLDLDESFARLVDAVDAGLAAQRRPRPA
jgi:AcrR family transcriptional regulator